MLDHFRRLPLVPTWPFEFANACPIDQITDQATKCSARLFAPCGPQHRTMISRALWHLLPEHSHTLFDALYGRNVGVVVETPTSNDGALPRRHFRVSAYGK